MIVNIRKMIQIILVGMVYISAYSQVIKSINTIQPFCGTWIIKNEDGCGGSLSCFGEEDIAKFMGDTVVIKPNAMTVMGYKCNDMKYQFYTKTAKKFLSSVEEYDNSFLDTTFISIVDIQNCVSGIIDNPQKPMCSSFGTHLVIISENQLLLNLIGSFLLLERTNNLNNWMLFKGGDSTLKRLYRTGLKKSKYLKLDCDFMEKSDKLIIEDKYGKILHSEIISGKKEVTIKLPDIIYGIKNNNRHNIFYLKVENINQEKSKWNIRYKFVDKISTKQNKMYRVKAGDTLTKISSKFNISIDCLVKHNNLPNRDCLKEGIDIFVDKCPN